jgi:DNA repair exonuclease SbcCD ATPase subunit
LIKGKMGSYAQIATILVGISIAVLVIAALIILTWLSLRIFVRRWRQQSHDHSLHTRSQLEAIKGDVEAIQDKTNHYSPDDPEPYGPIAQKLQHTLTSIRRAYPALTSHANNLAADTLMLPAGPASRFLLGFWREPRYWRRRVEEWAALELSIQDLLTKAGEAASLADRLRDIPAQVARQIEELRQAIDASLQITRELDACGVHGDTLDAAVTALQQLQARLSALPTHSPQDSSSAVEPPEKEDFIAVWHILKETRRPVGAYLDQLQQWRALRQDIDQGLKRMLQVIKTAAEGLDGMPSSYDSSGLAAELKRIHNQATALEEASLSMTIQDFPDVAGRVSHVTKEGKQLIQRIENVDHRFERFRQAIGATSALLNQIQSRMNQMAQIRKHPLVWGQYQAELARLRTLETSISVITDQWSLDQIDERTIRANRLAQEARSLEGQVDDVLNQRDQLIRALDQPELSLHPGWLNVAQDLHRQITTSQLVQADWPKNLAVSDVLNDAQRLVQRHKQWVPAHSEELLLSSQIGHRLAEVHELVSDLATFQRRLQDIANHLRSGELEAIRQTIERFVGQMRTTQPSLGTKVVRHLRSLERLERRGRKLTPQIDSSSTRMIREGARQVDNWIISCYQSLRALPPMLQTQVTKAEADLRSEVAALQNWAPFDREPAMKEAQQLLRVPRPDQPPPPSEACKDRAGQIISLVNQAREILQERHSLYIAQENVRSQIRDPIRDRFDDLEKKRQEAQRKLEELRKLKKGSESAWPPLICDIQWAEEMLNHIRREEQELHSSSRTVSGAVKRLNALVESYESIVSEVTAREAQLRQERQELQYLLDQLDRWEGQLKAYRGFHYQDQVITEAIQVRLSEIHRAVRDEKRRHNRPLAYSEARQALQTLWAFAHDRDLPLDGGQVISVRDIEAG